MLFWSRNLRYLRKQKGFSQMELADALNISRSKIAHYESEKPINPPVEELIRISEYFHVSIDILLKSDLSNNVADIKDCMDLLVSGQSLRVLAISVDKLGDENVELVPIQSRAGYQSGYKDPEYIASLPKFILPNLSRDKTYRIFPTHGDSMYPYPKNCMVVGEYVTDWRTLADVPCIVILKTQQDFLFKMVRFSNDIFSLRSLNSLYETIEVAPEEIVEIWKYRNHMSEEIPAAQTPVESLVDIVNEIKRDVSFLRHQTK
ncbi:XRE family transcriptional regulator [Sphingobacterium multivorum]|uniref:XRE family transcriptional regulator n=1 Tax=Sphingobacterium multivorum TaxID=28454 RepID=UPI003DA6537F